MKAEIQYEVIISRYLHHSKDYQCTFCISIPMSSSLDKKGDFGRDFSTLKGLKEYWGIDKLEKIGIDRFVGQDGEIEFPLYRGYITHDKAISEHLKPTK